MTATIMMFFLRPYRSDRRPPITAPKAAPRVRLEVTIDCWKALSPSPPSDAPLARKGSAPEMTPVSYPKSRPPRVAMVRTVNRRLSTLLRSEVMTAALTAPPPLTPRWRRCG